MTVYLGQGIIFFLEINKINVLIIVCNLFCGMGGKHILSIPVAIKCLVWKILAFTKTIRPFFF